MVTSPVWIFGHQSFQKTKLNIFFAGSRGIYGRSKGGMISIQFVVFARCICVHDSSLLLYGNQYLCWNFEQKNLNTWFPTRNKNYLQKISPQDSDDFKILMIWEVLWDYRGKWVHATGNEPMPWTCDWEIISPCDYGIFSCPKDMSGICPGEFQLN